MSNIHLTPMIIHLLRKEFQMKECQELIRMKFTNAFVAAKHKDGGSNTKASNTKPLQINKEQQA